MDNLKSVMQNKVSRRKFIAGVSAGMGATAAVTFAAGCDDHHYTAPTTPAPTAYTDNDILNFALNLEYVESEYFLAGVTGTGLTLASDIGAKPGPVTGGKKIDFTATLPTVTGAAVSGAVIEQYAVELANIEITHLRTLRAALGSAAIDRPTIDFTAGFAAAATAAGIALPSKAPFDPFADPYSFVLGGFLFGDVGVTALHGAATLIKDKKTALPLAGGLQGVESYQAAELRTILAYLGDPFLTYANQIAALRANASGVTGTTGGADAPIGSNANGKASVQIVPTDSNSIAYDRNFDQVLHIVYLDAKAGVVSSGGFFPAGLNGNIKASAS